MTYGREDDAAAEVCDSPCSGPAPSGRDEWDGRLRSVPDNMQIAHLYAIASVPVDTMAWDRIRITGWGDSMSDGSLPDGRHELRRSGRGSSGPLVFRRPPATSTCRLFRSCSRAV